MAQTRVETKQDRFKRLATKRMQKALNDIRLVGNLSGPGYESTPEQVNLIERALAEAVTDVIGKLHGQAAEKQAFNL